MRLSFRYWDKTKGCRCLPKLIQSLKKKRDDAAAVAVAGNLFPCFFQSLSFKRKNAFLGGNHGGCITVESVPGDGSVFRAYLPVSAKQLPNTQKKAVEKGGSIKPRLMNQKKLAGIGNK